MHHSTPQRDLASFLSAPADCAPLAAFRIAFGVLVFADVLRYFLHGWIATFYIQPIFHFTYLGFGWVRPWPGIGMYIHFALMGVFAIMVAAGIFYRASAPLLFLTYSYVFLLDRTYYQNHLYLLALLSFLFCFISPTSPLVPRWQLEVMRAQIAIVYFFGAVAKLDPSWLRGEPLRIWFAAKTTLPVLGPLLALPWAPCAFALGGLFVDLFLPGLLYRRRTWAFGVALGIAFHLLNAVLWDIGIFPGLMIAAMLLFTPQDPPRESGARRPSACVTPLLALFAMMQVFLPLRHWLYPGDPMRARQGDLFAWRMKLYDIDGELDLHVFDPATGKSADIEFRKMLTPAQADVMRNDPEMVLQFCHYLAALRREAGLPPFSIHADLLVSINGGPRRGVIDPHADLTRESRGWGAARWILP